MDLSKQVVEMFNRNEESLFKISKHSSLPEAADWDGEALAWLSRSEPRRGRPSTGSRR